MAATQYLHHQGEGQHCPGNCVAGWAQQQRRRLASRQHSRRLVLASLCTLRTCIASRRGASGHQRRCCCAAVMLGLQPGVGCAGERYHAGYEGEHAACWLANHPKAARLEAALPPGCACPGQLNLQHCQWQDAPAGAVGHLLPWLSAEQTRSCQLLLLVATSVINGLSHLTVELRMLRPAGPAAYPVAARSCWGRRVIGPGFLQSRHVQLLSASDAGDNKCHQWAFTPYLQVVHARASWTRSIPSGSTFLSQPLVIVSPGFLQSRHVELLPASYAGGNKCHPCDFTQALQIQHLPSHKRYLSSICHLWRSC